MRKVPKGLSAAGAHALLAQYASWEGSRTVASAAWQASRRLSWAVAAVAVIGGVLPIVQMVIVSSVIGEVLDAVRLGGVAAGQGGLYLMLAGLATVYMVSQSAPILLWSIGRMLGARLDAGIRQSVVAAAFREPGLDHMEDRGFMAASTLAGEIRSTTFGSDDAVRGLAGLVSGRIQGLAAVAILAFFHWWAPLLLAITFIPWDLYFRRGHREAVEGLMSQTVEQARAAYFRSLGTDAAAGKEVRIFGLANFVQRRFRDHILAGMEPVWQGRTIRIRRYLPRVALVLGGYLVVFGTLGYELADDRQTVAATTLFVLAAGQIWRIVPGFNDLSRLTIGSTALRAARKVSAGVLQPGAMPVPAESIESWSEIRFEGVSFAYPGSAGGEPVVVFRDLSLSIRAGESLGIVGDNGAGKTTLVKLLCGLCVPDSGRITVDGVDLRALDMASWRRQLAAVFQDFVRYPLTVRENVTWGAAGELDDDELNRALIDASAAEVLEGLERGVDTSLGREFEGGVELSGGQWQRLAVARALAGLYQRATILILDEPTANLDVRAEARLFERILTVTSGLTTVLISHRFANVRRADRIVVLDTGKVAEDGSHDELLGARGRYAKMFELQASRFRSSQAAVEASRDAGSEAP